MLPETDFHGLDMSEGAEIAKANGWVSQAHTGIFPEMVAELSETYDAISMFHYMEHTLDPKVELAAAAEVLLPGGHLVIELPNPESRWGRVLGKYWVPWLQPQHLNLMPIDNLCRAAEEVGLRTVERQTEEPHWPIDVLGAVAMWSERWFGNTDVPWKSGPPSKLRNLWHKVGVLVSIPLYLAAGVIDKATASYASKHGYSNAYRVLFQKG
ncbi:SAM-dependent methyltransferase [Marmoricola sp. OAE513]